MLETLRDVEDRVVHIDNQITAKSQELQRSIIEAQTLTSNLGTVAEDMMVEKEQFDAVQKLAVAQRSLASKSLDRFWDEISLQLSAVFSSNKKSFEERYSKQEQRMLDLQRQIDRARLIQGQTRCDLKQLESRKDKLISMQRAKHVLLADGQARSEENRAGQ